MIFDIPVITEKKSVHWACFFYQDTRRRQQTEAAEKRLAQQEQRGIGNVNAVKRQQQLAAEREKREQEAANVDPQTTMKVNAFLVVFLF